MGTIAVHDADFFKYENVIPNLECAKLVTYYRNNNEIALLTPHLAPERYTKFIVRKEYNDDDFPKELFAPNCEYGGRAFNPSKYIPLSPKIEKTIPDMHIYDKYISYFGKKKTHITQIKRILNCAHIRLAPDSKNLLPFEAFKPYFDLKPTGIFLHDYDLASLKPYDLIKQLQDQRKFITKFGINPYPVGNKYPIIINNPEELEKWMQIVTIPNAFFLEYRGFMPDALLYKLCLDNKRMARQIYYNVSSGCSSENDFFINVLPKIFIQALFLRKAGVKILLTYDEDFLKTHELKKFIELINCWISFQWKEGFAPLRQTLYVFCRDNKKLHYTNWAFQNVTVSVDECRDIFQYTREKNYDFFKLFYECDSVILKKGVFVSEW